MTTKEQKLAAFSKLLDVMDDLRAQCPWDKKQTYQTLRHLTIEETYELGDAILDNNEEEIKKELGDLLLHIVFYAKIGSENKTFDISHVANGIVEKLIYRHPHIYSDVDVKNEEEVKANWEKLKLKEGKGKDSVLQGVPKSLPALVKAGRIQEKVAAVGFEWKENKDFLAKINEELEELKLEIKNQNKAKMEAEYGDLLFALINFGRTHKLNAENALEKTNKKFINRFQEIEKSLKKKNTTVADSDLSILLEEWKKAKAVFE